MSDTRDHIFHIALLASAMLMAMLLANNLCQNQPTLQFVLSALIIMFEVVAPIEILKRNGIPIRNFNIYAHYIDSIMDRFFPPFGVKKLHPDFPALIEELRVLLRVSLIVFLPYVVAYWAYFKLKALAIGANLAISLNWPPQFFYEIIIQIFVVALPEEVFYRGFVQSAFLRRWPKHKLIFGFPLGWAVIFTNIIFAFGHWIGSWSPERLLTFFPGLVFSYLVYKNKSLFSAILFHAACNILGQILYTSLFLQ
ncbi:MAG TPA: CPBP family intramembrane glutamic endopeptidase [Myxococcota bacterium]|nr:CPBP family intramembrane glutamic endopeptidase [Myxococcota bacterium]